MNNIETLKAALSGFKMEHGSNPDFILMSSDIFRSISIEVQAEPLKYSGVVDMFGEHIKIDGVEIAQCTGSRRMEMLVDPLNYRGMKLITP